MAEPKDTTIVSGSISTGSIGGRIGTQGLSGGINVPRTVILDDYNKLRNKPTINGVELSGDMTSQDLSIVSENTTAGWNSNPQYLPKAGEICIYTDYATIQDDMGNDIVCPGIKIGDGNSYLIDIPFVGTEIRYAVLQSLRQHESNTVIHVSQADRDFWNSKLNYDVSSEELIFNRN